MSSMERTNLGKTVEQRALIDKALLERLKQDDETVWPILYKKYEGTVKRYITSFLSERSTIETLEELTQDTFLEVYQHRHSIEHFKAFLLTVARSTTLDYLAALEVRQRNHYKKLDYDNIIPAPPVTPEQQLITKETIQRVRQALGAIKGPTRKQALIKRYYQGKSHQEIAKELDLTSGSAKTSIYTGKKSFLTYFNRARGQEDDSTESE